MPIIQLSATVPTRTADGKPAVLPPAVGLAKRGPRIQVALIPARGFSLAAMESGQATPDSVSAVRGWALLDTGASTTCIDEEAAVRPGLPVVGKTRISSASHDSIEMNLYPINLEFTGQGLAWDLMQAPGASLARQGLLALLGRDVLQHCLLVYNGELGICTLAAP